MIGTWQPKRPTTPRPEKPSRCVDPCFHYAQDFPIPRRCYKGCGCEAEIRHEDKAYCARCYIRFVSDHLITGSAA